MSVVSFIVPLARRGTVVERTIFCTSWCCCGKSSGILIGYITKLLPRWVLLTGTCVCCVFPKDHSVPGSSGTSEREKIASNNGHTFACWSTSSLVHGLWMESNGRCLLLRVPSHDHHKHMDTRECGKLLEKPVRLQSGEHRWFVLAIFCCRCT